MYISRHFSRLFTPMVLGDYKSSIKSRYKKRPKKMVKHFQYYTPPIVFKLIQTKIFVFKKDESFPGGGEDKG
jgi:hypothetical protein